MHVMRLAEKAVGGIATGRKGTLSEEVRMLLLPGRHVKLSAVHEPASVELE